MERGVPNVFFGRGGGGLDKGIWHGPLPTFLGEGVGLERRVPSMLGGGDGGVPTFFKGGAEEFGTGAFETLLGGKIFGTARSKLPHP